MDYGRAMERMAILDQEIVEAIAPTEDVTIYKGSDHGRRILPVPPDGFGYTAQKQRVERSLDVAPPQSSRSWITAAQWSEWLS
jgi:hypothetical protein